MTCIKLSFKYFHNSLFHSLLFENLLPTTHALPLTNHHRRPWHRHNLYRYHSAPPRQSPSSSLAVCHSIFHFLHSLPVAHKLFDKMSTSQTNTIMEKPGQASESKPINDVNIISNLPDDILELILSLLSTTEEVVRTSILLKRWIYLWKTIKSFPSLNIDCSRRLKPFKKSKHNNKFKKFVYWALENETLDLDSFSLSCLNYYHNSTIERWIHAAVRRKVKSLELILRVDDERIRLLPHCVINSDSLESLRLVFFGCPLSLPNSVRFSALS